MIYYLYIIIYKFNKFIFIKSLNFLIYLNLISNIFNNNKFNKIQQLFYFILIQINTSIFKKLTN